MAVVEKLTFAINAAGQALFIPFWFDETINTAASVADIQLGWGSNGNLLSLKNLVQSKVKDGRKTEGLTIWRTDRPTNRQGKT